MNDKKKNKEEAKETKIDLSKELKVLENAKTKAMKEIQFYAAERTIGIASIIQAHMKSKYHVFETKINKTIKKHVESEVAKIMQERESNEN